MRVLLADDSPTTRFALEKNLEVWGYEVLKASDGDTAWDILSSLNSPCIAILDWMMPGKNGVEICRLLTQLEHRPFVYTILLTAKTETQDLVKALENGAHSFLSKPISPEVLRSHLGVGRRLVEAEERLRESEARYQFMVMSLAEGVLLFDEHGHAIDLNPAAERILGRNARKFLDQTTSELCKKTIHEDGTHFEPEELPVTVSLKKGEPCSNVIMGLENGQGTFTWVSVNTQPLIREGEEKPYGVLASLSDITQLKLADDEKLMREKLQAAIATAGTACHELNQPLQSLVMEVDLMLMHVPQGHRLRERLDSVRCHAQRMARITRDLNNLAFYQTKEYVGDAEILDLRKSAQ